jgi:Ca2+-binding RTX toxin-like protein
LDAGTGYVVRVEGDGSPTGISTAQVVLRDALGASIDAYVPSGSGIVRAITPAADQTIYVDIGTGLIGSDLGAYVLSVTPEVGYGLATNASIAPGETVRSRIDFNGDGDWYRFEGQAGLSYTLETLGDGSATSLGSHTLSFHDPRGEKIGSQLSLDPSGSLTITAQETGSHYVSISAFGAGRAGLGYELTLARTAIEGADAIGDTLTGTPGDDILSGFGGDDWLRGGDGDDLLEGGQGVDILDGGEGNDVLVVSDPRDFVRGGGGHDEVRTSVSFALEPASDVERISAVGSSPVRLVGTRLDETLTGNSAANVLAGFGGEDTVTGGRGADTFALLGADRLSDLTVTDFSRAEGDRIAIDDQLLGFGTEAIHPRRIGPAEASRLLESGIVDYLPRRGLLELDPDGDGTVEAVLRLDPEIRLTLDDLIVF